MQPNLKRKDSHGKKSFYVSALMAAAIGVLSSSFCLAVNPTASIASTFDKAHLAGRQSEHISAHNDIISQREILKTIHQWQKYLSDGSDADFETLSKFITANPDWPKMGTLKRKLEAALEKSDDQQAVYEWFEKNPPKTARGIQFYAKGLTRLNRSDDLKTMINDWWSATLMPRSDQRFLYSQFGAHLSRKSHLKRLDKLLYNRQYTNARAIADLLGKDHRALVEARIALKANKNGVDAKIKKVPKHLQQDAGLMLDRLQWRRRKNTAKMDGRAIEILTDMPPSDKITNRPAWWKERHIIIRRLLERGDFKRAGDLASGHIQKDGLPFAEAHWLAGWLALRFGSSPKEALKRFTEMHAKVKSPISRARAAYWAGEAAKDLRRPKEARKWYSKAAIFQTTYYGQKAAQYVQVESPERHMQAPQLSHIQKQAFKATPLMQAAWLFKKRGDHKTASLFLNQFIKVQNTSDAYMYAILQAQEMKNLKDVVSIAKRAAQKGWFVAKESYPIIEKAKDYAHPNMDIPWLHAIIRQESEFDPSAKSRAGARGLMQLMPSSAKHTAKKHRIRHYTKWLFKPRHNIEIGTTLATDYLKYYNGYKTLATLAYNAGPGNLNKWLRMFPDPRKGEISMDDFIELCPYSETRNYAHRVLEAKWEYSALVNRTPSKSLFADAPSKKRRNSARYQGASQSPALN